MMARAAPPRDSRWRANRRAVGRTGAEIVAHALEDGLGDACWCAGIAQLCSSAGIGDVGRLDQHRGNVRRFQHEEAAPAAPATCGRRRPGPAAQHALGGLHAGADAGRLRQVHQHRGQLRRSCRPATRRPSGRPRFRVRPASAPPRWWRRGRRARKPRSRTHRGCGWIGMHGDEDVGARRARDVDALAQRE